MKIFLNSLLFCLALLTFNSCGGDDDIVTTDTEICNNNIDDDGDGLIDCDDSDCTNDSDCEGTEICNNNIDDDGDGLVDCDDPDCTNDPDCSQTGTEICDNNIDDDGDGFIDCDDSDCDNFQDCIPSLEWSDLSTFNQVIKDLEVFDGKLFITGNFTERAGANCYWSAYLSNNTYTNHTSLIGGGGNDELTVFDNQLHAASSLSQQFSGIGLAVWDGSTWDLSGPSINEGHSSIYTDGTTLYLGSGFGTVSYKTASGGYQQYPTIPGNQAIYSMTAYNGSLIVGGAFTDGILRWDGNAWQPLGGGVEGDVRKVIVYNNQLIAAGDFQTAGGQNIAGIAAWDGNSWSDLDGSLPWDLSIRVTDMLVHNNALYAVGNFTNMGSTNVGYVAKWNGSTWQSMNYQDDGDFPNAVEFYNGKLYIGTFDFEASHLYSVDL